MHEVEYKPENYKAKSEKYDLISQKSTGRKCITTGRPGESSQNRESHGDKGELTGLCLNIVNTVFSVNQMTLCFSMPGTAQYIVITS